VEVNMNCKKCGKTFEPSKGLLNYCSMSCRNSREHSDEVKEKIRQSVKEGIASGQIPSYQDRVHRMSSQQRMTFFKRLREIGKDARERAINSSLKVPTESLSYDRLRRRILHEQNYKCNICDISDWLGKPISLELEHKDGNNRNNKRENLEVLCPNCHSQTPTFRGRNPNNKKCKVKDDELLASLVMNDFNIRKSLIAVGMTPKGGNYKRCHKLKRLYLSE